MIHNVSRLYHKFLDIINNVISISIYSELRVECEIFFFFFFIFCCHKKSSFFDVLMEGEFL